MRENGCVNSVDEASDKAIPLVLLSIYGNMEEFVGSSEEKIFFTADRSFAGEMSAPLDLLMEVLYKHPEAQRFGIICTRQESVVDEWNRYAAEKIFSGKVFDRRAERQQFLAERFGKATGNMNEYFRILERQIIASGALSGLCRPSRPGVEEIISGGFLEDLEASLTSALQNAESANAQQLIKKELEYFQKCKQSLQQDIFQNIRRIFAGSGQSCEFTALYGDAADIKTSLTLEADPEKMVIILVAEEPLAPEYKLSKVQARDFVNMWAEDCFEIFLVPDENKPQFGWQFIVNSRGSLWDARHTQQGQCDMSWSAENASVEFEETANAWKIKLSVPWQDLGFDGMPEKDFLANIYRNRAVRGVPRKSYAWSPIYAGAYYQVAKFGRFIWEGNE